jgi:hypothetical protein
MPFRPPCAALTVVCLLLVGIAAAADGPAPDVLRAEVALRGLVVEQGRPRLGPHELSIVEGERSIDVVVAGIPLDRLPLIEAPRPAAPAVAPAPYERPGGVDGLDGSGYPAWLHRVLEYRRATVGRERALDEIERDVRESDLVRRYERLPDGLLLFDATGTPYFVGEQPLLPPNPMSRADVEALALRTLEAYRGLLESGGAIVHFDDVDLFLPPERVADTLIPSLEILEDPAAPTEAKRRSLAQYWKGTPIVEPLLSGYRSSDETRLILDQARKAR